MSRALIFSVLHIGFVSFIYKVESHDSSLSEQLSTYLYANVGSI